MKQKDTELVARIHNYGTEKVEKLNVTLFIDDNKVESTEIDIEAESSFDAAFRLRIDLESKSVHTGWVEIDSDELEIDNRQYFTVQSMKSIRVHCVNGEQRKAKIEDETFYLTKALQNTGSEGAPIIFTESTTIPATDSIEQYDVIILANLARIPATEAERIKDYVNEGGTLMITVGDQVDSSGYQHLLGSTDTSLMPCTLMQAVGDPIGKDEFQVIASVNYRHPIFATFSNPNHGDFGKGRFYRYFQAVPTPEASVIAAFDDGNPALIEKMYGNGRVLCFTSTIDREWNDLPIHGVYLPFLHETIRYLAIAQGTDIPDYMVGDGIEYKGSKDTAGKEVAIFDPEKKEVRKTLNDQGNLFYENTDIPGIYSLHSSGDSPHYFVINVDSIESDLTTRNSEELTSMLVGSNETERGPVEITPEIEQEYHEGVEKNQGIATYILLAVFALAISEMFLANRV